MKLQDFNNSKIAKGLIKQILDLPCSSISLMEVCGTHTFQIAKLGLRDALCDKVKFLSGPGCPVCVSSMSDIDKIVQLSKLNNVILTTFGDMVKVPGSDMSLAQARAQGADIRVLYSPIESLQIAQENQSKQVILVGIGFETTTPLIASTIIRAKDLKLDNFCVFSINKNMPHALHKLLQGKNICVDGMILPGHVSTIIGVEPYNFIAEDYQTPGVVAGFELVDILQAVLMLVKQICSNTAKIENAYTRAVKQQGNLKARKLIEQVFDTCPAAWRGFGTIEDSGYKIKDKYAKFDASLKFDKELKVVEDIKIPSKSKACSCDKVLAGIITPDKCPMFKKICKPEKPLGPCMVSSEGSCAAYYKYLV